MARLTRLGRILALSMSIGLTIPSVAPAQEEEVAADESSGGGKPIYGYLGTGVVLAMIIFAVCKSARR